METYTTVADQVKEMKKRKQSVELAAYLEGFDEEYEVLLLDEQHFRPRRSIIDPKRTENVRTVRTLVAPDVLAALKEDEHTDSQLGKYSRAFFSSIGTLRGKKVTNGKTKRRLKEEKECVRARNYREIAFIAVNCVDLKLERELKRARSTRKQHEQDQILAYVGKRYAALDAELDELEVERVQIVYESVYMNLYILTMHQEFIVLKRFEKREDETSRAVERKARIVDHLDAKVDSTLFF